MGYDQYGRDVGPGNGYDTPPQQLVHGGNDGGGAPPGDGAGKVMQNPNGTATFNWVDNTPAGQGPNDPGLLAAKAQADALNNHYNYGGYAGGASQAADFYQKKAAQDQDRPGVQVNYQNANGDRSNNLNDRELQLRASNGQLGNISGQIGNIGQQQGIAGLLAARANGSMPSIASMQAQRDMGRAMADQSSIAAGARGPGGLALAGQQAAFGSANAAQNISNQAQINGAQEQLANTNAAMNAYGQIGNAYGQVGNSYSQLQGVYGGIRSGDQGLQGQDAQQAQAQAAQDAQQRALNDQGFASNSDRAVGINTTQLQAQGNQISTALGAQQAQAQLAQNSQFHDQDRTDKYIGYGLAGAGTAAGIAAMALLGGSSNGTAAPTNTTAPGAAPVGGPTGGGGNPGSFDPATGAPVSGAGGGYDPNGSDPWKSDARAKTDAFRMGQAAGLSQAGADPRAAAWDEGHKAALADMQKLAHKTPEELRAYGDNPLVNAVRGLKADGWDEGRGMRRPDVAQTQQAQSAAPDPNTAQFANGLAPYSYQYKPGQGPPGSQFGPMAQNMASQPATASAVQQGPDGLMRIDPAGGTKLALGGVGHLAQKQQQTDEEIARLKAGLMTGQGRDPYETRLSPAEEAQYVEWKRRYAPNDSGADYDMRGAFRAGLRPDPQNGHWPDTFKKPNHATFSDESKYAAHGSPGHWNGETFQVGLRQNRPDPGAIDAEPPTLAEYSNRFGFRGNGLATAQPTPGIGDQYLQYVRGQ